MPDDSGTLRVELMSESIPAAEYDERLQELKLTFTDGRSYRFAGVPRAVFDGLVAADSPGSYYHASIRGRY